METVAELPSDLEVEVVLKSVQQVPCDCEATSAASAATSADGAHASDVPNFCVDCGGRLRLVHEPTLTLTLSEWQARFAACPAQRGLWGLKPHAEHAGYYVLSLQYPGLGPAWTPEGERRWFFRGGWVTCTVEELTWPLLYPRGSWQFPEGGSAVQVQAKFQPPGYTPPLPERLPDHYLRDSCSTCGRDVQRGPFCWFCGQSRPVVCLEPEDETRYLARCTLPEFWSHLVRQDYPADYQVTLDVSLS